MRRRRGDGEGGSRRRTEGRRRRPVLRRRLVVPAAVALVGFGSGWLVATRTLFPAPPSPGDLYEVPDLYGADVEEAERRVERAGLTLGVVDPFRHPVADSGRVVGQAPLPGQLARPGTPVRVSVSLGVERRPVPEVVQLRGDRARVVLEAAGFIVLLDSAQSEEPRGRVVSLDPPAGTQLPVPGEVRLLLSMGPAQVTMPSLLGMEEADAREVVEGLGLVVAYVQVVPRPEADHGRVVDQDPAPERPVERGSAIGLVVGGSGPVPAPDTVPGAEDGGPPPPPGEAER